MRQIFLALALVIGCNTPATSQQPVDIPEVREIIDAQVDAFLADDPATAFLFASPFIQRLFKNPDNFRAMVEGQYPMVWNPADVVFFDQSMRGDAVWQRIRFVDQSGVEHWFAYEMVDIDNMWRINGVFPIEPPDFSV